METSIFELSSGKKAKIKRLEGREVFQRKLASLNIRVGKTITKIATQPFRGPVVVEVDNTKVTLGRRMAMRIFVEEEK
jgi:Fe2+ transport system protein FeoA